MSLGSHKSQEILKWHFLTPAFAFYFSLPFSFSSFGKYFEDVVSFLSQTRRDLNLWIPRQSIGLFICDLPWDSIALGNSRGGGKTHFIHFQKNGNAVHLKHKVCNTDKIKLIVWWHIHFPLCGKSDRIAQPAFRIISRKPFLLLPW